MPPPFSWHRLIDTPAAPSTADPRRRLRLFALGFLVLASAVFARIVQLEVSQGAAFRDEATRPLAHQESLPGVRGRILASNGTVLACDQQTLALAVHYRYLEEPANPQWLRTTARARLSVPQRKNPQLVAAEIQRVRDERADLAMRLATLCGMSLDEWRRRAAAIQARVEHIAATVNRRRLSQRPSESRAGRPQPNRSQSWLGQLGDLARETLEASMDEPPPEPVTIAEEYAYHIMAEDVSLEVAAELVAHPKAWPSAKIVQRQRRVYTAGSLAAHVLGHLGVILPEELATADGYDPDDRLGRMGLERQYEKLLHGRRGLGVEFVDRSGRVLSTRRQREPGAGRDLVLTLDCDLQRSAESLLDDALTRRQLQNDHASASGGAIVVLNAQSGAVLAAASAPRFDPNLFTGGRDQQVLSVLHDPTHPLLNRATMMAIAPGSVFKLVTAVALLQSSATTPEAPFLCRGYLSHPDQWRCALYRRQGIGHGEISLADALAQSCNVFFLHYASLIGPDPLLDWARRLGFGDVTGIDLPEESPGVLPTPASIDALEHHAWRKADTLALAIGQGSLQMTPLQIARLVAALANGGFLVTPHLVRGLSLPLSGDSTPDSPDRPDDLAGPEPPRAIPQLTPSTLAAIDEGLKRVVADPEGTAHASLWIQSLPVAAKTGTAETDNDAGDHAWLAGYAPADRPKVVFVVALEHAGNADQAAAPVAKRIVLRLEQLGYFDRRP